ncbi:MULTISPECIES: alpha/beta hydrolase [unclassified Legionella]|uniref:alpha/beta hydrolase n=1 Tax=unclassified Legionella TaxID=2622702 RepID=UPI0010569C27|nr:MULTISPECIES: hypothetical protein [unclassified Legionella]MDI9818906.1 hypothetical protein [Legionella sp. PL877]
MFNEKYAAPGEHPLTFEGMKGQIESILTVPSQIEDNLVALLGHPHSLQGGTMNNKVVTTMARAFKELGIPSLRFNFRGVGHTAGDYDKGIGESEDMLLLAKLWQAEQKDLRFIFAGFSFGSYVAYRAAAQYPHQLLITIAPPVHHYDYREFKPVPEPWLILQGEEDEVVPASLVFDFTETVPAVLPVVRFAGTGHFFHGKLLELKSQLAGAIRPLVF